MTDSSYLTSYVLVSLLLSSDQWMQLSADSRFVISQVESGHSEHPPLDGDDDGIVSLPAPSPHFNLNSLISCIQNCVVFWLSPVHSGTGSERALAVGTWGGGVGLCCYGSHPCVEKSDNVGYESQQHQGHWQIRCELHPSHFLFLCKQLITCCVLRGHGNISFTCVEETDSKGGVSGSEPQPALHGGKLAGMYMSALWKFFRQLCYALSVLDNKILFFGCFFVL